MRIANGPFPSFRHITRGLAAALLLVAAAGCLPKPQQPAAVPAVEQPPAPAPSVAQPPPPEAQAALPIGQGPRVALLLPLSGQHAALGRDMLDAAQMALFDAAADVQLLPRDTGGTPQGAEAAAREAVADGAGIILGPLFAGGVQAAAPVAQAAGLNLVAFSTDRQVAGGPVHLLGLVPTQQVERAVSYAVTQGRGRFGLLAPSTPYGQTAYQAIEAAVRLNNAQLVRSGYYPPEGDASGAVRGFAQGLEADAVLLADGGGRLLATAPLLPYYDVDILSVKLLGTGQWDDPAVTREPSLYGAWFAAPDPAGRREFEQRFAALYGRAPARIATLSYDAVALAAALSRGPAGPDFGLEALRDPAGFPGLDGILRFRSDGIAERGLAVLEVRPEGIAVIDPAPTRFEPPAF